MVLTEERLDCLKKCSGDLWKTFKDICSVEPETKEKHIDMAFVQFKEVIDRYKGTPAQSYAVQYGQDLLYEVERLLYPGKVVKSNYQDTKRMEYGAFIEYIKNPNPGDLITITEDNGNLARIKVRTVINA